MSDTSDRTRPGATRDPHRSAVVAVALLDAPPEWDRLTALLAPGTATADEFLHRVVEVPLGLEVPRRANDMSWRLDRTTLPSTGGFGDVLDLTATRHTDGDEHRHWGLTLVDGLTGGQAAFVIRVVPPGRADDGPDDESTSVWDRIRGMPEFAVRTLLDTTGHLAGTAVDLVRSLLTPGSPAVPDPAPPAVAPRLHTLDVPAAPMREVTAAAGCATESGIAAAVLLGYAQYRRRRGIPLDASSTTATGIDPELLAPDGEHEPVELMRRVDAIAVDTPDDLVPAAQLFGHDDVLTCTVHGSPMPLHVAGAGIERYYGFGLTLGSAFNATVVPYHDTCCVGLSVDTVAVPLRAEFDACLQAGVRAVLQT